ncbi:DUF547 domain-containing protein [Flagellimonas nanhaiensis]|uniref:DUF547 domain-containing protein n=1 Tax=Flagellimonas nanhaiensis TaxID=2292706 RepID=A0A371JPG7_9FLAO|nr:DUF547 domain-containing protein [Allomuricauda nanhaiensis]RDY59410.1 DUF547 domain-containing protein [Allomuricauda nanhaiensis]
MNLLLQALLGVFLLSCTGVVERIESQASLSSSSPSHDDWNNLLQQYVDEDGNVNYSGFKKDEARLDSYLELLSHNPPSGSWKKNEKLAYYINLYNAATVKLIVDHYPVNSIKDISGRWKKNWIQIGKITTSLNDIEHKILRKMDEPRIHFAINCASYSCPKLLNVAFTPQNMEQLLLKTTMDFVNDPTRNQFEENSAKLSKIFRWYKSDFTQKSSLLEYINEYLENPIATDARIEYLDYDWSLNEAK